MVDAAQVNVTQSSEGVQFKMEGHKTMIKVSMSADEDEPVGKWKSKAFYMLHQEPSKSPTPPLTMTAK